MRFFKSDAYRPVSILNGGERVKAAPTKVFSGEVNTLVLDEPTNFLDVEAIKAFELLLREYNGSIIFVSHDCKFIKKVATRIMTTDNKEIKVFGGTCEQFKQAEKPTRSIKEDRKLLLEAKVTRVLGRLSIEPSEKLEQEFQNLVNEKRNLDK